MVRKTDIGELMQKPCNNCGVNIEQAILYDEVLCYKTCKRFKDWQEGAY